MRRIRQQFPLPHRAGAHIETSVCVHPDYPLESAHLQETLAWIFDEMDEAVRARGRNARAGRFYDGRATVPMRVAVAATSASCLAQSRILRALNFYKRARTRREALLQSKSTAYHRSRVTGNISQTGARPLQACIMQAG